MYNIKKACGGITIFYDKHIESRIQTSTIGFCTLWSKL